MGVITGGRQTLDGGGNGQRLAGLAISFLEALEELRRPANGKKGKTCSSVMLRAHDLAHRPLTCGIWGWDNKDWGFLDMAPAIILLDLQGRDCLLVQSVGAICLGPIFGAD
jgi:hypothetical protein